MRAGGKKDNIIDKYKNKYHDMSVTVKASLLFTVCGVLQRGISFLLVPIYTRIIPTDEYGEYSIFQSWYQLLMIFSTLNMWNYLINNGLTEFATKKKEFIGSLQGLAGLITIIWIIIYIPFARTWKTWTGLTVPMMVVMFAELLTMPSYEYWCAAKRYNYDAKGIVISSLIIAVCTPVVAIPIILKSQNKGFAAIASKSGVAIIVYFIVMVSILKANKKLYNKKFWIYALKFNIPLVPHFLSMMLLQSSDRIMIERMCGAKDAAYYSVAYNAAMTLNMFNSAILSTFVPYTYRAIKEKRESNIGNRAIPLLTFVGAINFAVALFAPEVIAILAPREYQTAIYVIPPVAMSNLLMFLFNLFANIEYYYKETKIVALASIISATVNVVLNYIFIKLYGFTAAGYTTLFCYILFSVCHYIFMRKVSRKHMAGRQIYDVKKLAYITEGFIIASLMIIALYQNSMILIRYGILMVVLILVWIKRSEIKRILRV